MRKDEHISRRAFLAASAAGIGALSADASEAIEAAPEQGGVWEEARALVDAGAIGRPYYVGLRLPRGVASFDDIAGHVARVSYALRLNAACRISAAGSAVEGEGFPADYMVSAKYEEGVTFSIATGRGVRAGEPYVMRGDAGTIRVYDSERPYLALEDDCGRGQMCVGGLSGQRCRVELDHRISGPSPFLEIPAFAGMTARRDEVVLVCGRAVPLPKCP